MGSSNFDYFSYHLHQELMVIIREPEFVKQFLNRVVEADLKGSKLSQPSVSEKEGRKAEQKMNCLFRLMQRLNRVSLRRA